jgi:hypothetical protein
VQDLRRSTATGQGPVLSSTLPPSYGLASRQTMPVRERRKVKKIQGKKRTSACQSMARLPCVWHTDAPA